MSGIDHQGSMPDVDVGVKPRSGVDVDGCGSMWGVVYVTCQRDTRPLRSHAADGPGRKEEEDETRERGRKDAPGLVVFGLWRVRFPPVLVRTGRRLPVQALGERGVLVSLTGYPRGGAPGPG